MEMVHLTCYNFSNAKGQAMCIQENRECSKSTQMTFEHLINANKSLASIQSVVSKNDIPIKAPDFQENSPNPYAREKTLEVSQ